MIPNCHIDLNFSNSEQNQNYDEIIISHTSELPLSKNLQTINAGEDVEKRETSYTIGGIKNQYTVLQSLVFPFD